MLLNVLKRLNTKSIDTQLCVTFDFGSVFHAELEDTKVTSIMQFFGIIFFRYLWELDYYFFLLNIISFILFTTLLFFSIFEIKGFS